MSLFGKPRTPLDPRPIADALPSHHVSPFISWNHKIVRVQELGLLSEEMVREFEIDWHCLDWDERLMLDHLLVKAGGNAMRDYGT